MPIVHARSGGEKGYGGGQFLPGTLSGQLPVPMPSPIIGPEDLPKDNDVPMNNPDIIGPDDLPGPMVNPKATNDEIRNFLDEQPLAKPTIIPIDGALLTKIIEKLDYWKRAEPQEYDQVIRITKLREIPPPIVQYYTNGHVGVPDGFHRIAAYYLLGRTSMLGYKLDGSGRTMG
jgi:hypothetical protein